MSLSAVFSGGCINHDRANGPPKIDASCNPPDTQLHGHFRILRVRIEAPAAFMKFTDI
jgi:hypothetical protein